MTITSSACKALPPVRYRAAAALPYPDTAGATAGLRGRLRIMALADGAHPDWSTLIVEGPVEAPDLRARAWFEWTATVEAESPHGLP
jgi:hypothetical protein